MTDAALLRVEHIAKAYGDTKILEDVSFELCAGKSLSITSPSGSGKSTILSIVGLLLAPDSGLVFIDGKDVFGSDEAELAKLRSKFFGFVFQHTQLIGSLRAYENVAVPARFVHDLDFDADKKAKELLVNLGLEERLEHYPHQLSVGQKRRVAVARALLLNPQIILADEPTNDLDLNSADSVANMLFEQPKNGKALILVTHDAQLAQKTDHQYVLKNGILEQVR